MSIKVIFISGNIGSGKETMLRYLDESLTNRGIKVKTILEPVELWRESGMLRRLYNGEYLEFQKYAITSRIDTMNAKYQEAINENCKLVLVETNPFVDLHVYSRTTLQNIYEYFEHWKNETQRLLFDFKKCDNLFIDVPPEVCLKRIEKRGRSEEKTVSLTYLQKLYYEHQMLNQVINPRVIHNDRYIYDNDELETQVESMLKYL